jgi:hypothetical protein
MGNFKAADTHLKGFYSLLDMTNTERWERRLHGLPMRMVLLCVSPTSISMLCFRKRLLIPPGLAPFWQVLHSTPDAVILLPPLLLLLLLLSQLILLLIVLLALQNS